MYRLVIAEKPSVSMSIAAVLGANTRKDGYMEGEGWLVSWCVGHLAGLADAAAYDPKYGKWRREDLPIIPENWRFTIGKDKHEQFDTLRTLLRREDVSEVVNACDAGRECKFALWKDNRFFAAKKKALTKATAAALLKDGRVKLKGCVSEKTGKTYDAVAVLDDTGGKYVNFKLEFDNG